MNNQLEVRLLGKFDLHSDGKPITIPSRPAQSLFAYLILNAGTSHRREKLAGLLWPDSLEETARDNLRHALWRIRKAFPPKSKTGYLLTDALSIAFNASSDYWLDAAELEKPSDSVNADELMAVLSEYQGELLPGFYDEWVVLEREHLNSIFEHKMARLMSLLQDEKRWLDVLDWSERWIKWGQKPEAAYRALMLAHAANGDMSKVAATYERCVKSLKEFGVEPSAQTKELYKKLKLGTLAPTRAVDSHLPWGIVTFLFTDIEGSTKLAGEYPQIWETLRARHHAILREAIESNNGYVFQVLGDGFCTAFHTPNQAFRAAIEIQQKLQSENWGHVSLKVRMGIHTGEAEVHGNEYRGYLTLSLVQRILSAGHGGQILLSHATEHLLRGHLPKDTSLHDLGEHKFKDFLQPIHIFQVIAPDLQKEFPALRAREVFQNNLPIPLTSFIGREREIEEVKYLLSTTRLLTLTGTGGIGKTRLAIQAAKDMVTLYQDGIWWVELAPVIDEALVPQTFAQVLGVRESPNRPLTELLKSFLREKQLLLILDNCEHLIAACAQLVADVLIHCENLRILTTSREALGITGETTLHVPALSFPVLAHLSQLQNLREFESVQLFAERATAVHPELALTQANVFMVTQICHRLDGLPLALELAAARVKMLSLEEIAKRLDDRFTLLTQGSRTALPRHQTLHAAIDWSHDLLTDPERTLFRRLAVFVGGFTFPAMESVVVGGDVAKSQVIDLLGQLIDKSLVTVKAGSEDSETRYGMLETIREYAREKLDESREMEGLRQRHRDFFIALAEQAEPELRRAEQMVWLDRLEGEYDNLRAAWDSAIESDAKLASRLAAALLDFWMMRGNPSEGREWLSQLLPKTAQWGQTTRRARVLSVAGRLSYFHRDIVLARHLLEEALAIARAMGDKKQMAFALNWLGYIANYRRDDQTAQAVAEEGLTIYQELQDPLGIVETTFALAMTSPGQYPAAEERCISNLAKLRELGDNFGVAYALNLLGNLVRFRGDYEQARQFYEENLEILRKLGSRVTVPPMFNLAWVSLHRGEVYKAKALFEESFTRSDEAGDKGTMTECLTGFAGVLAIVGKPEQAARLMGAAEALLRRIEWIMAAEDQKDYDHYITVVRDKLGEAAFVNAWEEGRAMTLEQAIEFALKESEPQKE